MNCLVITGACVATAVFILHLIEQGRQMAKDKKREEEEQKRKQEWREQYMLNEQKRLEKEKEAVRQAFLQANQILCPCFENMDLAYFQNYITTQSIVNCECRVDNTISLQHWYKAQSINYPVHIWAIIRYGKSGWIAVPAVYKGLLFYTTDNKLITQPEYFCLRDTKK